MTISSSLHHFTISWNLFYVTTSMFFAFILYGLYKIIVCPLMRMKFYKQQGIPCSFFPLIGIYKSCISSLKNHGDAKYYVKIQAASAPERLVCSNLGSSVYLSFFDPVLIKEFYLNNENYVKDPIFLEMYKTLLGEGIITSEGTRWKTQRKILSSCFHFDFIKSIVPDVQKTVHQNLENLKNSGSLNNVNILDVLQKITGEVVGKLFFGEELNTYQLNGQPLTLALTTLMCDLGQLTLSAEKQILGFWVIQKGIFPKHKKIMETIRSIRGICSKVIQERRRQRLNKTENLGQKDMLDLLIDYSDSEGKMTDEDITDQFVTFFMAGTDTTGHVALMTIYFLQKYPNFREKVMEEVLENYKGDISVDKLNKMEFTMGVIKETLRTVTPVAGTFPRRAVKDHQIKDITVRKGDLVILDYFYNSFDPKYFDNEQEFDPARWLDKEKMKESYAFTPFSAGPRNCIGQHISLIELKIIMAEFLKTFDFKVTDGYELKLNFKFLYEPVDPVLLNLVPKGDISC